MMKAFISPLIVILLAACQLPKQFDRVLEVHDETKYHSTNCVAYPCVAIVSHSTLNIDYIEHSISNHSRYAKKHGYDYKFRNNLLTEKYIDEWAIKPVFQLGLYWQKIEAVNQALNAVDSSGKRQYDFVMWIDPDAIFTNFAKKVEDFTTDSTKHFWISQEPYTSANSGVFIVRNSEWGRRMFAKLEHLFPLYKKHLLPEQMAIQDYLFSYVNVDISQRSYRLNEVKSEAVILPQRTLNSFYQGWWPWAASAETVWQPQDYVAHMAVVDKSDRLSSIRKLLKCFEQEGGADYANGTAYFNCR